MPHDGGWYSQMLTDAARFIKMHIDVPGCRKMHMNTARYCKTPSDAGWYSQILLDATGCIRMFPDSDAHKKRPVIMLLMQLDVSWYHSALWCTCLELHSFGATYTIYPNVSFQCGSYTTSVPHPVLQLSGLLRSLRPAIRSPTPLIKYQ